MKKYTKLISALAALSMLAGCSETSGAAQGGDRLIWSYSNVTDNGMLYSDGSDRLNFLDFGSMNSSVLCSKPNCPHTDPEVCTSFGMSNHPILYDNKLYFFNTEWLVEKDETLKDVTTLYRSETDGSGRAALRTIDGLSLASFYRMVLIGDKAYFYMAAQGNDGTSATGYDVGYFCTYDLSSGEFKQGEEIYRGYHSGAWIYGAYNNKIYFAVSYAEEEIEFPFGAGEAEYGEYTEAVKKATITEYKVFDTESGAITDSELPEPVYAGGGYYVYEKEGGLAVLDEKGAERLLEGYEKTDSISVFNGTLFNFTKGSCAKLRETGAVKMLDLSLSEEQSIEAYYEGSYIIKEYVLNTDGSIAETKYKKIPEAGLIG